MKNLFTKGICLFLFIIGLFFLANGLWIKGKPLLAGLLLRTAWERSMSSGQPVKAWPWADSQPTARIKVERLGIDSIVLEGDSGEVLAFGPGHVSWSAQPLAQGNCIFVGHRDTSFAFLKHLHPGDTIKLADQKRGSGTYRVQSTSVVSVDELYFQKTDNGWLTLITCYPFDAIIPGTNKRYVVFAKLDNVPGG